jgi:hypothetical protein
VNQIGEFGFRRTAIDFELKLQTAHRACSPANMLVAR